MELLIKFKDQSESYVNGVELGRLLQKMEDHKEIVSNNGFPLHLANKETFIDLCECYGYKPIFGGEHFGEWVEVIGVKSYKLN